MKEKQWDRRISFEVLTVSKQTLLEMQSLRVKSEMTLSTLGLNSNKVTEQTIQTLLPQKPSWSSWISLFSKRLSFSEQTEGALSVFLLLKWRTTDTFSIFHRIGIFRLFTLDNGENLMELDYKNLKIAKKQTEKKQILYTMGHKNSVCNVIWWAAVEESKNRISTPRNFLTVHYFNFLIFHT